MRTNERETLLQEYPQLLEYYYSKKLIDNDLNNIAKIITYTKNNGKLQLDILHHPPKDLMTIVTIRTSCMEAKVYEEFAKMEYYFNILTATNIFVMKKDHRLTDYYYTFFTEEVEVIETPIKEEKVEDTPIVIEDNSDVKMLYKVIPYLVTLVGVLLPYVLNLHGLPKWGMLVIFVIDAVIVAYSCNELIKMG